MKNAGKKTIGMIPGGRLRILGLIVLRVLRQLESVLLRNDEQPRGSNNPDLPATRHRSQSTTGRCPQDTVPDLEGHPIPDRISAPTTPWSRRRLALETDHGYGWKQRQGSREEPPPELKTWRGSSRSGAVDLAESAPNSFPQGQQERATRRHSFTQLGIRRTSAGSDEPHQPPHREFPPDRRSVVQELHWTAEDGTRPVRLSSRGTIF